MDIELLAGILTIAYAVYWTAKILTLAFFASKDPRRG